MAKKKSKIQMVQTTKRYLEGLEQQNEELQAALGKLEEDNETLNEYLNNLNEDYFKKVIETKKYKNEVDKLKRILKMINGRIPLASGLLEKEEAIDVVRQIRSIVKVALQ